MKRKKKSAVRRFNTRQFDSKIADAVNEPVSQVAKIRKAICIDIGRMWNDNTTMAWELFEDECDKAYLASLKSHPQPAKKGR